ncbi:MAG TPA: cytochrome b [Gammaproteobacteria bacterium]
MRFRNSENDYGLVAILFHWLIAALVFIQLGIGIYVDDLPISLARLQWLSRHKATGFVILVLVLARLAWRLVNPAPALPGSMAHWERRIAHATHWLLYGLLITAPLAGWLHADAAGLGVNVFGLFSVPDLMPKNRQVSEMFHDVHVVLVAALAVLLLLHVAAALRHALLRDGVFGRMLPWK